MVGVREEPELDVPIVAREFVELLGHLVEAALLDPLFEVEGGNHLHLDFQCDAEQAQRQPLRLEQLGMLRGVAPASGAIRQQQAEAAHELLEVVWLLEIVWVHARQGPRIGGSQQDVASARRAVAGLE